MASTGSEPVSRLRSLLAKVLGGADSTTDADTGKPQQAVRDGSSHYEGDKGQNWLSHYASIAPDHIKRWTNPEDGTGNIPYEQLVENLQQFNIPARHVSQYTVGQLLGVEPAPQENPLDEQQAGCPGVEAPVYQPRSHKLGPQAAAYLGSKQDPGYTQVVPVRAVTKAFVGPVRDKVGTISGESCKLLKRPNEYSEVPPDYVEVAWSKQVQPVGCDVNVDSRLNSDVSRIEGAVGPINSELLCHKPPPIYLEPVLDAKRDPSNDPHVGKNATAEYLAKIPKCVRAKVDLGNVYTKEDKEVYDALKNPVVYTMGTYIWSKEQAEKGEAHPVDPPPIDACFGKLCEEMFSLNRKSEPCASTPATEPAKEKVIPETSPLGIPEIIERCRQSRTELAAFADTVVEAREDPAIGGQGLFSTAQIKKGQVVFVEVPLLTCDIEGDSMWTAFKNLTDEQKAAMETLEGFQSDLSEDESLWCILMARANNRVDMAKSFKSFFAKMKRNAHGLPSQARWGLYAKAAKVNHSCEPNVTYRNLDGLLVYFATRDISPGDMISMTYIDQLYASASFRTKRLLQSKCFKCKCTRCNSPDERERRMLCPSCRPLKLKIVDSASEVPAVPPSLEPPAHEKGDELSSELSKLKKRVSGSQLDACQNEGDETSAQASDDDSKCAVPSSDDEEVQSVAASSEQAWEGKGRSAILEGEAATSECGEGAASNVDDGFLASDEDAQGCTDDSDSASNNDRLDDGLSEGEVQQKSSQNSTKKAASRPLMLSIYPMEASASKSTEWGVSSLDDDQTARCLSDDASSDSHAEAVTASQKPFIIPPPKYCQRGNNGIWLCHTCGGRFTDNDLPIGMEDYFERLYLELQNKFNLPTTPQWTVEVGSLIKSIEVVLGTQHWLYAACNLLLAQLYLGQWVGGMIRDSIFERSLKHAEVFMNFVETTTPEALHVDCAPLVASLMRVLLFNGRWSVFEEWVEKGRLDTVQDCLGPWDETFVSFWQAHQYLRSCQAQGELPQLAVLHRYAHTAQHSIVQAAEQLEQKEAARKKALEDAASEKARKNQVEQQRLRILQERNRRLRERVERLKAEAAAQAKIKDVTGSHPEGILAKFMLAGVDHCIINDAAMATQRAHEYAKKMQEAALQGRQLVPGNIAADKAYLPPQGIMPSAYLPLIMLDDPLRSIPEKRQQARQRRAEAAREQAILQVRSTQQDLDFEEDESVAEEIAPEKEGENESNELTMIYRIPGLPGTAPGEFVNVSQLVHDENGKHEPLPLFKSFFYIDTSERKRNVNLEDQKDLIVLGSSGSPPPLSNENLDDLEAAKYNYLHEERQRFEKDVKDGVLLAAAEAGALEDETKLVDVIDATNKVIQGMTLKETRAERALESARYAYKGMEPPAGHSAITKTLVVSPPNPRSNAKPQAHTTGGVGKHNTRQEPKVSPKESATMPSVWEYVPSQDPGKGPTVFLYPPTQLSSAGNQKASNTQAQNKDSSRPYMRSRIVKPLDFSHIPPPPTIEALVGSLGNTHRHYKMARMNTMLRRYASPVRDMEDK